MVAVVNGKGGVGKTTLARNLAVYTRTIDSDAPVLAIGFDDASAPDELFALDAAEPEQDLFTALQRGSLESAIRPGRYGVYYVPASRRTAELARRSSDRFVLKRALARTAFGGTVFVDTAPDAGLLTQNAIAASDFCVVPAADLDSLFAARRLFDQIEAWELPRTRARVVLSMLDLRIRYKDSLFKDPLGLLVACARKLELPLFQTFVARSPKVQALASNPDGRAYSILNEASRTNVHHQLGELAEELLEALARPIAATLDEMSGARSAAVAEAAAAVTVDLRPRTPEAAFAVPFGTDEALRVRDFPFFIGRDDPEVLNDLPIHDLQPWEVSRRHAHLVLREGRVGVVDLGSRHGTWVDDRQLGGPTADPGPAFFARHGGELVIGRRGRSPYVFDVRLGAAAFAEPVREAEPLPPMHAAAVAALLG